MFLYINKNLIKLTVTSHGDTEKLSQAELSRKLGLTRARITQMLNILKLNPEVIRKIIKMGDEFVTKEISERKLRKVLQVEFENQLKVVLKIINQKEY